MNYLFDYVIPKSRAKNVDDYYCRIDGLILSHCSSIVLSNFAVQSFFRLQSCFGQISSHEIFQIV